MKIFGLTIITTRAFNERILLGELRAYVDGFRAAKKILQTPDVEMEKYNEFSKYYLLNRKV